METRKVNNHMIKQHVEKLRYLQSAPRADVDTILDATIDAYEDLYNRIGLLGGMIWNAKRR